MAGAWACDRCIAASGLDVAGQASSAGRLNWCGAGGHAVAGEVRWAPDVAPAAIVAPAPPSASTSIVPAQGSLF